MVTKEAILAFVRSEKYSHLSDYSIRDYEMHEVPNELRSYIEPSLVQHLNGLNDEEMLDWLAEARADQTWIEGTNPGWDEIYQDSLNLGISCLFREVAKNTFGTLDVRVKLSHNKEIPLCEEAAMLAYWGGQC